jgi:hypothetical protein
MKISRNVLIDNMNYSATPKDHLISEQKFLLL